MNYWIVEIDSFSFGSFWTLLMLYFWRGPSRPSINVALRRIINSCSKESLARLSISLMTSYLQENQSKIGLMNHKNEEKVMLQRFSLLIIIFFLKLCCRQAHCPLPFLFFFNLLCLFLLFYSPFIIYSFFHSICFPSSSFYFFCSYFFSHLINGSIIFEAIVLESNKRDRAIMRERDRESKRKS